MRQTVLRRGANALLVALVFCVGCGPSLAEIKVKEARKAEEAELRKCLSFERCKLDCPDGGEMKIAKTKEGLEGRYCEKNGQWHGPTTAWHKNGKLRWKYTYKDGELHGLATKWYDNGQMKAKGTVKNGKQHGVATWWHENGTLKSKSTYKDGEEVKDARAEEAELRKCLSFERCKLDCPDGGEMKAGKTDQGFRKRFCEKDGKKYGPATAWHYNGPLYINTTYKNGEKHGLETTWHENGKLQAKYTYKDGKLHGLWTGWHENGQMMSKAPYKNGKQHGLVTWWYDNGQVELKAIFKDGKQDMTSTRGWDTSGKKK